MKPDRENYKNLIKRYLTGYTPEYVEFCKERYAGYKYLCGFGVGNMGGSVWNLANAIGRKLDFYCDNDRHKTGKKDPYGQGVDVIALEQLCEYKEDTAVIIPTRYYKEIYSQLKTLGFPMVDRFLDAKQGIDAFLKKNNRDEVINALQSTIDILADEESCRLLARLIQEWVTDEYVYGQTDDLCTEPQYFPKGIITNEPNEVYVDCGAYIGDNIGDFINFSKGDFRKYYAFELSKKNYLKLQKNVCENWAEYADKFILENKGVSNSSGVIKYEEQDEGSKLEDRGTMEAEVTALDEYFSLEEKVTFIKMDIEGAEMHALQGAERTISRNLPKLAICIYHKPQDLWEIPLFIKRNWEQYDIFIRHHTDLLNETVCYAVPRR